LSLRTRVDVRVDAQRRPRARRPRITCVNPNIWCEEFNTPTDGSPFPALYRLLSNGTRREDSEVRGKTRSPHHVRVPGSIAATKISAVQELLVAVLGVGMNSLVRLLGFTTLGCGCVTGHYREIATNREVTYVEEKGTTCNQNAHRRNHTVAPARFGMHALSAKAS
jgi:hypothetical protein